MFSKELIEKLRDAIKSEHYKIMLPCTSETARIDLAIDKSGISIDYDTVDYIHFNVNDLLRYVFLNSNIETIDSKLGNAEGIPF